MVEQVPCILEIKPYGKEKGCFNSIINKEQKIISIDGGNMIKSEGQLDPPRLKKFEKLKSGELKLLASHIIGEGKAAYQELLTDLYIEDVRSMQAWRIAER